MYKELLWHLRGTSNSTVRKSRKKSQPLVETCPQSHARLPTFKATAWNVVQCPDIFQAHTEGVLAHCGAPLTDVEHGAFL